MNFVAGLNLLFFTILDVFTCLPWESLCFPEVCFVVRLFLSFFILAFILVCRLLPALPSIADCSINSDFRLVIWSEECFDEVKVAIAFLLRRSASVLFPGLLGVPLVGDGVLVLYDRVHLAGVTAGDVSRLLEAACDLRPCLDGKLANPLAVSGVPAQARAAFLLGVIRPLGGITRGAGESATSSGTLLQLVLLEEGELSRTNPRPRLGGVGGRLVSPSLREKLKKSKWGGRAWVPLKQRKVRKSSVLARFGKTLMGEEDLLVGLTGVCCDGTMVLP